MTKEDAEESTRGYFRSLSKSCTGLDRVIAGERESVIMTDVCAGSKENVTEGTYKFPLIKSGDGSVYQNVDDWKRTRFRGKAQQFSLGNTEFQVAMSHPTEI